MTQRLTVISSVLLVDAYLSSVNAAKQLEIAAEHAHAHEIEEKAEH